MEIRKVVLGYLQTNCYLLTQSNEVVIIDPADDADLIIEKCNGYKVVGILVTHHHPDHIGALSFLEQYYKIKHNSFEIKNFSFDVIKTPGHTGDSISIYFPKEQILFSGDFLFNGAIGRCDFEDSSINEMKNSLNNISNLPDNTIIYPGHGEETILKNEKKHFKYYF